MSTKSKEMCCAQVWRQGTIMRMFPCSRKAVVERDGLFYCKQHDPEEIKARDRKATEKFNQERAVRRIQLAGPDLLAVCERWANAEQVRSYIPDREKPDWDAIMEATKAAIKRARG